MSRILITSGPTRQYLDPVRYLTNASSGRMGKALAEAAIASGHQAVIVSGPVTIQYPRAAEVVTVVTTEQMLAAARKLFPRCDGLIGAAAPCDYRPRQVRRQKINKTGKPLVLELLETRDVVATLGAEKGKRWVVGFALETEDEHFRAITKLERKRCDLVVINGPQAIDAAHNRVTVIDQDGNVVLKSAGQKKRVAREIFRVIQDRLIGPREKHGIRHGKV
jgi:phosphopantothenoylcysteine decarboxylase/phosphopantothenate--cysteine ligase